MPTSIKCGFTLALLLCLTTLVWADSEDGKDCEGCSDSALLVRYPGSVLLGAEEKAFDEGVFPIGPTTTGDDGTTVAPKTLTIAGKRSRAFYYAPAARSALEVFANYRQALEKSGANVTWTCSNAAECGPEFLAQAATLMRIQLSNTPEANLGFTLGENPRYLLATMARPQGTVHIGVLAADLTDKQRPGVYVMQVEDKPMDQGMAAAAAAPTAPVAPSAPVDSATLDKSLASSGQVNLYGIHFDIDKADIKPESRAQLDEIAKLLRANPALRLTVTGHTDNTGAADHNQILSKRRADAIVAALGADYGIAAERLAAAGLGASAPVASNDSEQGRALNRRVELVRQ
ncbi:MAG: OmpA family protein [Dokdonella sp.]